MTDPPLTSSRTLATTSGSVLEPTMYSTFGCAGCLRGDTSMDMTLPGALVMESISPKNTAEPPQAVPVSTIQSGCLANIACAYRTISLGYFHRMCPRQRGSCNPLESLRTCQ